MSQTWGDDIAQIQHPRFDQGDYLRILVRSLPLAVLVFGCLVVLLLLRLIERPIFGVARPWTPHITQFVCRNAFRVIGMGYEVRGKPMTHPGAMVANHSSWLDIFALNAPARIYFAAKAEVSGWAGIGWLARATGTVFIERNRQRAAEHTQMFEERLRAGHQLMFFPEGTSTDGRRVLPFKSTLFAAFYAEGLPDDMAVQPVSLAYHAPKGADPRYYGWWGSMDFGSHLLRVLATKAPGSVEVVYHPPIMLKDVPSRKVLARALEEQVAEGLSAHLSDEGS